MKLKNKYGFTDRECHKVSRFILETLQTFKDKLKIGDIQYTTQLTDIDKKMIQRVIESMNEEIYKEIFLEK